MEDPIRIQRRWEDNIKMYAMEIEREGVRRKELAHDRV
jgi:hypothetical protein